MTVDREKSYLTGLFRELRQLPNETEWVEFKEAKNNFHFDDLGKYFSALSKRGKGSKLVLYSTTSKRLA